MLPNTPDEEWQEIVLQICAISARHILAGMPFPEFRQRMLPLTEMLLTAIGMPLAERPPEMLGHLVTGLALEIWNATPLPDHGFRPKKIARPELNAPCLCGSGKKYQQCCTAAKAPELGINEDLMLVEVLAQIPPKALTELPLLDLHPEALAMAAARWIDEGEEKKAISLLERFFLHLDQLDGRAELAADTLLNAYLQADAPRKKQKFIDRLKTAPDKILSSTGWQRQVTVFCDKRDFPAALKAFQEAQRLTPNEPALSHLEVLMLVVQGRHEEARARVQFWVTRLTRDSQHDHGELIATLHRLVGNNDKNITFSDGPLPIVAAAIAQWLPVACHYSLKHGELLPRRALEKLEISWLEHLEEAHDLKAAFALLGNEPLAGQSFLVLADLADLIDRLPETQPGSADALRCQLLERGEALRQTVLAKLKAGTQELPWGILGNRPLQRLAQAYIFEFTAQRPEETLNLLRWCVTVVNPGDNLGLRGELFHRLVATGLADEALQISERYANDFLIASVFGRILAFFAAGRREEAESALRAAHEKRPKLLKMLLAANPRQPRPENPGYITVGSDDEAWEYRNEYIDLWRLTGALAWASSLKLTKSGKTAKAAPKP